VKQQFVLCGGLRPGKQIFADGVEDQPGDPGARPEYGKNGNLLFIQ
jgi:hypothetical protein